MLLARILASSADARWCDSLRVTRPLKPSVSRQDVGERDGLPRRTLPRIFFAVRQEEHPLAFRYVVPFDAQVRTNLPCVGGPVVAQVLAVPRVEPAHLAIADRELGQA